jgi:lipopolysaccharide transport system ATP-binding protein
MSNVVIQIEDLWKEYRLGVIGHGTLTRDLQSWWARVRGKEDPNSKIMPMLAGQEKQIEGDRFWALRGINLEVKEGEILGIIGKNGAGKSTLLKILSRVTAPTKGQVKIKGRIASLLEVGTGFHPELTGRENIFMNGAILGMSKREIRSKLDEIIDFSGVEKFIDTPVKRYSSGMYVRLAFAVAAHLEPEILVVDEVLAVGDAEFQAKAIGKMENLSGQCGRTVIFVSHNMLRIKTLCERGLLLQSGLIHMDGPIEASIFSYTQEFNKPIGFRSEKKNEDSVFHFTGINFLDKQTHKEIHRLICGDSILVRLTFFSKEKIENIIFSFGFFDMNGNVLFACNSSAVGMDYNIEQGYGYVDCIIDKFPISQGSCYININAKQRNIYIDNIMKAVIVDIELGDYYNTGVVPNVSRQSVLIPYRYC